MDREDFARQLNYNINRCSIDINIICSYLKISRSTLGRWRNGVSYPYYTGRDTAINVLKKLHTNEYK